MSGQSKPLPTNTGDTVILATGPTSPAGRNRPARRRRQGVFLATVGLVVLSAVVSLWFLQLDLSSNGGDLQGRFDPQPVRMNYCTSTTATQVTELDPEQAGNAAIIAAVAKRRGLPARAAAIGIATALQESKLRNIAYGDQDSLGLFQQRPSQGWGTRRQITNPVYSVNAFYNALTKVHGYLKMPITKAAQKVQRSAFPAAYAAYGPTAESVSATLGGYSPAGFTCVLRASSASPQAVGRKGVTGRAAKMRAAAAKEAWAGTTRVLSPTTIRFRVTGNQRAWTLAEWAVARASDLEIVEVQVAGRVWDRAQSTDGWTETAGSHPVGVVIRVA